MIGFRAAFSGKCMPFRQCQCLEKHDKTSAFWMNVTASKQLLRLNFPLFLNRKHRSKSLQKEKGERHPLLLKCCIRGQPCFETGRKTHPSRRLSDRSRFHLKTILQEYHPFVNVIFQIFRFMLQDASYPLARANLMTPSLFSKAISF